MMTPWILQEQQTIALHFHYLKHTVGMKRDEAILCMARLQHSGAYSDQSVIGRVTSIDTFPKSLRIKSFFSHVILLR